MIPVSTFVSLCAVLLALSPDASRAARPVTAVAGIITEAAPNLPTIESGNEVVVLKITRKTRVFNIPPGTPGTPGAEPDAELEVARRAEGTYDPKSKAALSIAVTRPPEVTPRTGILTAAGPLNTVTFDPEGGGEPEELVLEENSGLLAGTVAVSPGQLTLLIGLPEDVLQFVNSSGVERLRALLPRAQSAVGTVRSLDGATDTSLLDDGVRRRAPRTELQLRRHSDTDHTNRCRRGRPAAC